MHPGYWLEGDFRVVGRAGIVAVNAQPMRDPLIEHKILADDRQVALGLTGDAGLPADAGVQIDRHCPGVARVAIAGVERLIVSLLLKKLRVLLVFGERALIDQITPGDAVMTLRCREAQSIAGLAESGSRDPW